MSGSIRATSVANDKWSLFGFDLRKLVTFARLGTDQLLFDSKSAVARRLAPPVGVWDSNGVFVGVYKCAEERVVGKDSDQVVTHFAVVLPEDDVLTKSLVVPASSEILLDEIVASEVLAVSPFPAAITRSAWSIQRREDGLIEVMIAITSADVIEHAREKWHELFPERANAEEVWVLGGTSAPVVFKGFAENIRREFVIGRVRAVIAIASLVWLTGLVSVLIPSVAAAKRADYLETALFDVRQAAGRATAARSRLLLDMDRLVILRQAISDRHDYAFWLQNIAKTAPDDVYFERLKIEGDSVEVSGFADNAASYLRILTEQPQYSDVEAAAAFVRNRRTGLELFTIKWSLVDEVGE